MAEVWQTVRVFISSTFKDMQAERDHLVRFVFPRLREKLLARRVHLIDVDLRWGVTDDQDALELCKDEIERCHPRFICVLGGRYGWVPAPREVAAEVLERVLAGESGAGTLSAEARSALGRLYARSNGTGPYRLGKRPRSRAALEAWEADCAVAVEVLQAAELTAASRSITASEVYHGVLDRLDMPAFRYFYFRDPDVTASIPEPFARDYFEPPGSYADRQLAALKDQIRGERGRTLAGPDRVVESELPVFEYPCEWDEGAGRITRLEAFGEQVYADLLASVEAELGAAPAEAPDEFAEESAALEAFVEMRVGERYVVGTRSGIFRRLRAHAEATDADGYVCLAGERGSGKSALLAKFYRDYVGGGGDCPAHPEHLVIAHFVGASPASTNIRQTLLRLCHELARGAGLDFDLPDDYAALRREFARLLDAAAARQHVVILFDGVDQLDAAHQAQAMRWLPERLPANARVILTAAPSAALDALLPRLPPPLELPPLEPTDATQLIDAFLERYRKELEEEQRLTLLAKKDAGNPLYLLTALEELRTLGVYEEISRRIVELPDRVRPLFGWILDRLEADPGFVDAENRRIGGDLVRRYCAYIGTSRSGLAQAELVDLVAPGDPLGNVAALYRLLRRYLVQRGELLDFSHDQLREVVWERYLGDEESRRASHCAVAGYFRRVGDPTGDGSWMGDHPRALGELPYHLQRGGQAEALYALIESDKFRAARLAATRSIYSVCSDIGLALDAALERDETARIACFGFMHADYSEGRFGRQHVLELHRHDPEAALEEARLFGERPRFRLLLLLAVREAELGQREAADELIAEAAGLEGIELPESEAPLVADAVARLLGADCTGAPALLAAVFQRRVASEAAARVAASLEPEAQAGLLEVASDWLNDALTESMGGQGPDLKLLAAFKTVSEELAELAEAGRREALFAKLEAHVEAVQLKREEAAKVGDTILALTHLAISVKVATDSESEAIGSGYKQALLAHLVVARIRAAAKHSREPDEHDDAAAGCDSLAPIVEACGDDKTAARVFGEVTRALRRVPSPQASRLFNRLLSKASGVREIGCIVEALGEDEGGPGLAEAVGAVATRIQALGLRQRSPLLEPLALAFARAGQSERARHYGSHVNIALPHLSLLAWNPLVGSSYKLEFARDRVGVAALTGVRDRDWSSRWLKRLARWMKRLDWEPSRVDAHERLVRLAAQMGDAGAIEAGLEVVDSLRDEDLRAKALGAVLEAAQTLDGAAARDLRRAVLERAGRLEAESPRCRAWGAWLDAAEAHDLTVIRALRDDVSAVQDHALRALTLGQVAAASLRLDRREESRTAWYEVALADQSVVGRWLVFRARAVAAAAVGDSAAWDEVLHGVSNPDPEVAALLVRVAAEGCREEAKLVELERAVLKVRVDWLVAPQVLEMRLAVARAWVRLGRPGRGAELARRALRGCKRSAVLGRLDEILETARLLAGHRLGCALLLELVPVVGTSGPVEIGAFVRLAGTLAGLPDERWAREAFRQLYLAAQDNDRLSDWNKVQAIAAVAGGLARRGQLRLAEQLAESVPIPSRMSSKDKLLNPAARAAALAELGSAYAEIALWGPALRTSYPAGVSALCAASSAVDYLSEAVAAAAAVEGEMGRGSALSAQLRAWLALRDLQWEATAEALVAAERTARAMAEGSISAWEGLAKLAGARAELGEGRQALELAAEIDDDDNREELLVDLAGKLSCHSFSQVLDCWERIPSAEGRRLAAVRVAEEGFRLAPAADPGPRRDEASLERESAWSFATRRLARAGEILLGIGLLAGVPAAGYWAAFAAWRLLGREPFVSYRIFWIPGLIAVGIVATAFTYRMLRHDIDSVYARAAVGLGLVALAPLFLGFYLLLEKYLPRRPALRARTFSAWRRWRGLRTAVPRPPWRAKGEAGKLRPLLRLAVGEAASFDALFGAALLARRDGCVAAELLERLPHLRLPTEAPERIRENYRIYEEGMRSRRRSYRLREAIRNGASKIGFLLTGGFIFVPIFLATALVEALRAWVAQRAAARAARLLGKGKATQAVRLLKRAKKLEPDNPTYWHDFAVALDQDGRFEEGISAHREAVARGVGHPDEPQFWYGLGYTLFLRHRYQEALEVFERILETASPGSMEYSQAQRGRGYCRTNLGLE
jgi:hypothetical protein